jgi:hypothetical protein
VKLAAREVLVRILRMGHVHLLKDRKHLAMLFR